MKSKFFLKNCAWVAVLSFCFPVYGMHFEAGEKKVEATSQVQESPQKGNVDLSFSAWEKLKLFRTYYFIGDVVSPRHHLDVWFDTEELNFESPTECQFSIS